jgi:hypothetical protein
MKKILTTLIFIFAFLNVTAQKADQFNSWWYFSGKYQLTEKFNVQTLYSWSRHDFINEWQQSKLRLGAGYNYLKNISFNAGYEWIVLFPYGTHPVPQKRTEHRIYEQFIIKSKIQRVAVNYGVQLEQRIMADFTRHRLRMIFGAKMPLITSEDGKTKLGVSFFNQVFLDIDKCANGNYFSQNRVYGGFDIPLDSTCTLSLGFMNQYIIINDTRIENDHTLMVCFFHKLDFRKKD